MPYNKSKTILEVAQPFIKVLFMSSRILVLDKVETAYKIIEAPKILATVLPRDANIQDYAKQEINAAYSLSTTDIHHIKSHHGI